MTSSSKSTLAIDESLISDKRTLANVNNFVALLSELHDLDDKKKTLWRQIYENAVLDRENARALHDDLTQAIMLDKINHATYGLQITKYLERMSRANDQLIKLAEMIAESQEHAQTIDHDAIYSSIEKSNGER